MGKKRKRIIILTGGILFFAAIICAVLFFVNRKEEYRTIQIYRIEGSAIVERDGVGSIDAYDGMMMQSGDTVYTDKESCLYFKMDEDKFALLEPESTVHMEASGTSSDSRTIFRLESSALVSRLDSKLSPDSVYEVNTPNSTMAVRGTIFRIEVTYDENGVSYTNVYVFDGTVECRLVFADGSVDEEVKQAQKGVMVRIRGDSIVSEYILDNGTVDYGDLPVEVLEFLKIVIEEGIELPVGKEELEAILAEIEKRAHEHSGGTATCISPAICSSDDCGQPYGEKEAANHVGGSEIRNETDATCAEPGYTGDIYCLGCGEMIQAGSVTEKETANHVGGTEIRDNYPADCCNPGYTGNAYCLGCDIILEEGTVINATGDHPSAACGIEGHHAHDGLDHNIAPCQFAGHRNCDGNIHGDNCYNADAAYFDIEVVVTDNGGEWSFTFNNTVYYKDSNRQDGDQYYYYFQGYAGDTITVSRTGTTGDFHAVSEGFYIDGTESNSLSFTLNEGEQQYVILVAIS